MMCIGIPAKVVSVGKGSIVVEMPSGRKKADSKLVGRLEVGDFVYVQSGFAVKKLRKEEALETLKLLKG